MSSEHLYGDYRSDISGSDFDHGESMTVKHYPKDECCSDCVTKAVIPYKFREDELMAEIQAYIDGTYGQHYSRSKFQASEFIFDNGHGVGMNVGCIMKYAQRYGKKDGYNRKDILKIIHYAILLLYVHDEYIETKKAAE